MEIVGRRRAPSSLLALGRCWLWVCLAGLAAQGGLACAPPAEPSAVAPDGRIHASFWFSYGGRNREVLEELIARFNRSQDRYQIDGTFQGSYFEALAKLRMALITHQGPVFTHVIGEVLPYLWTAGVLEDLTPYPARTGQGAAELAALYPPLTQDGYFDYTGVAERPPLFALPFNRSTPIMLYNRDLFEQEGLTPPTSWEELRQTARRLTVRRGGQVERWGLELPVDWWFWLGLLYQAGGSLLGPDGRTPTFHQGPGVEALQLLVALAREEQVLRPPPGQDFNAWEVANNDLLAGRAAMIWTSTAFLSYLTDNARFRLGAAPLPGHRQRGVPTGGTFFVMLRRAPPEAKAAAWAFICFMLEPAQAADWARRTGYLPVNRHAAEQPALAELYRQDPNYQVALEQLAVARPFPFSPALFEIQREQLQPRLDLPVLGLARTEDALAEAAAGARKLLARNEERGTRNEERGMRNEE